MPKAPPTLGLPTLAPANVNRITKALICIRSGRRECRGALQTGLNNDECIVGEGYQKSSSATEVKRLF